jgi:hypothetical protein
MLGLRASLGALVLPSQPDLDPADFDACVAASRQLPTHLRSQFMTDVVNALADGERSPARVHHAIRAAIEARSGRFEQRHLRNTPHRRWSRLG